jgi:hypothetical protein
MACRSACVSPKLCEVKSVFKQFSALVLAVGLVAAGKAQVMMAFRPAEVSGFPLAMHVFSFASAAWTWGLVASELAAGAAPPVEVLWVQPVAAAAIRMPSAAALTAALILPFLSFRSAQSSVEAFLLLAEQF